LKQIIFRADTVSEDIEVLKVDENGNEYFSAIDIQSLMDKLKKMKPIATDNKRQKLIFLDDQYIAFNDKCVVINQQEHKRIVTYQNKAYNILFPNSIYFIDYVDGKIKNIEAYSYKEYEGKETELFKYPMPNMLTENRICIGSAPRSIVNNDYVKALENIIFTQYTHSHVDNIKSFKETIKYFEYLSSNKFPYDLLISTRYKLKDIL